MRLRRSVPIPLGIFITATIGALLPIGAAACQLAIAEHLDQFSTWPVWKQFLWRYADLVLTPMRMVPLNPFDGVVFTAALYGAGCGFTFWLYANNKRSKARDRVFARPQSG